MSGYAEAAQAASPGAEHGHRVALAYGANTRTRGSDYARIFMAKDHGQPRQDLDIAINDMNVAVTKAGSLHGYQHLARPRRGRRYVIDEQGLTVCMETGRFHQSSCGCERMVMTGQIARRTT